MRRALCIALCLCWSLPAQEVGAPLRAAAYEPLPLASMPPGNTFLVLQPHHDDHTTDYGMGD